MRSGLCLRESCQRDAGPEAPGQMPRSPAYAYNACMETDTVRTVGGIAVEIALEKPDAVFAGGETIAGEVRVVVHEDWTCKALAISLAANATARKDGLNQLNLTVREEKAGRSLFSGQWTPGRYSYPFAFEAPAGPLPYKGQISEVHWSLLAEALRGQGGSVAAEVPFTLTPGADARTTADTRSAPPVTHTEAARSLTGCFLLSLVVFLAGAATVWPAIKHDFLPVAIGILLLGAALLSLCVWQFLVNARIASAATWIATGLLHPGQTVPCSLSFQPRGPFEVEKVSVTLRCTEEAGNLSIHTSKTPTIRHVLHETEFLLPLTPGPMPSGVPVQVQGELTVPPDAPPSLQVAAGLEHGVRVVWQAEFRIVMRRWPDWLHLEDLTVRAAKPS
jgi:hypothetical protein